MSEDLRKAVERLILISHDKNANWLGLTNINAIKTAVNYIENNELGITNVYFKDSKDKQKLDTIKALNDTLIKVLPHVDKMEILRYLSEINTILNK